jgi:hypothetical protein
MSTASALHGWLATFFLELRLWVSKKTGLKFGSTLLNYLTSLLVVFMTATCTASLDTILSALFGIWVRKLTYLIGHHRRYHFHKNPSLPKIKKLIIQSPPRAFFIT